MMNPVHVRRDNEKAQYSVDGGPDAQIAVVEHGCRVQEHLEDQDGDGRRPERRDNHHLYAQRQRYFQGMKAEACGDVEIEVRVMHAVQPPQCRDHMEQDMLHVYCEIEHDHGYENGEPHRQRNGVQQPEARILGVDRNADHAGRRHQTEQQCIGGDDGEIVRPSYHAAKRSCPARAYGFPKAHDDEDREEKADPYSHFIVGHSHGHGCSFLAG